VDARKDDAKPEDAAAGRPETAPAAQADDEPSEEPTPADLLGKATRTIETARDKVRVAGADDAGAKSFEAGLDLLAEMTLSLRQLCEPLYPAQAKGG
jgi:hypothetical protein